MDVSDDQRCSERMLAALAHAAALLEVVSCEAPVWGVAPPHARLLGHLPRRRRGVAAV
ncbi:hypothetical protein [Streptosporangium roseum]|uniref:hypothetical protein n=1 Tax=Streptosporangium roseum TaxID=2001 RepID=UPI0033200F5E